MACSIFIRRRWQTEQSTISEFTLSGTDIKGYFLERPGPDTASAGLRKRIPERTYQLQWHMSPEFGRHSPVPHLYHSTVPFNRWMLIHPGNRPQDTEGCLLPGRVRLSDRVGESIPLFEEIKNIINE